MMSARGERAIAGVRLACDLQDAPDLALAATGGQKPQNAILSNSPSAEAIATTRDLIFESLMETGSLTESYSRSLTEAAWRGDHATVEVHLRQLRSCVAACIDFFKRLDRATKDVLSSKEGSAP